MSGISINTRQLADLLNISEGESEGGNSESS